MKEQFVAENHKTCLIGLNNPYGTSPHFAIYPAPVNCAGWRLWRLLADYVEGEKLVQKLWRTDYTRAFDRRNVLSATTWSAAEARRAGADALRAMRGRRVIVLGAQTADALGLRRTGLGVWSDHHVLSELSLQPTPASTDAPPVSDRVSYTCLPHPSGRCREYNVPLVRRDAGRILWEEFGRHQPLAAEADAG